MKKTLVSKEGKSANLTFECTKDEFAKACMEAYEKNKSRYSVDGFRKGKAPKKIIEAKFGKDVFFGVTLTRTLLSNSVLNKLSSKGA